MNEKRNRSGLADVIVSLGSNLGDREWNVIRGNRCLGGYDGIEPLLFSSLYESKPEGEGFSGDFVNAVSLVRTAHPPGRFLDICQEVEIRSGRVRSSVTRDRTLDIDIILFGGLEIDSDRLRVPHPLFKKRTFVLRPLLEIVPGLHLPPFMTSVAEALEALGDSIETRKISSRAII
ncbi:MAG: 2-amino-4-hydroxy-6-hydroxymethyldihydropteridine diphosphokinase [Candidatus Krumholzibacteriota bacterium]|nr:2-amino-4-hydroxy-6-hydroxymethyldihydropteridine diphosphokinase [Candidatus Krumholzibacteriota bacterium]